MILFCNICGNADIREEIHSDGDKRRLICSSCGQTTAWVWYSSQAAISLWNATCGCQAPVPGTRSPMDENDCGLDEKETDNE